MADLITAPAYDPVYQLETTDLVLGGAGAISNDQAQALGNRDDFLLQLVNATMQFSAIQHFAVPVGGVGWSGTLSASDSGKLWVMAPGSINGFFYLPTLASVPDNTMFGFYLPYKIRNANNLYAAAGEAIFDPDNQTLTASSQHLEGLCIVKKYPGAIRWETLTTGRDGIPGEIIIAEGTSGYPPTIMGNAWLPCNGYSLAVSAYPALFARIGYTFGGSGASFLTPNISAFGANLYYYMHS